MKPRIKRNIATVAGVAAAACGCAIFAISLLQVPEAPIPSTVTSRTDNSEEIFAAFDLAQLKSLFKIKLQRPLVDPVKKKKSTPSQVAVSRWPAFELSCILVGGKSRIAVFQLQKKSYSCGEGDSFGQIKVVKINNESVELQWAGKFKKVAIPEARKLSEILSNSRAINR